MVEVVAEHVAVAAVVAVAGDAEAAVVAAFVPDTSPPEVHLALAAAAVDIVLVEVEEVVGTAEKNNILKLILNRLCATPFLLYKKTSIHFKTE